MDHDYFMQMTVRKIMAEFLIWRVDAKTAYMANRIMIRDLKANNLVNMKEYAKLMQLNMAIRDGMEVESC